MEVKYGLRLVTTVVSKHNEVFDGDSNFLTALLFCFVCKIFTACLKFFVL